MQYKVYINHILWLLKIRKVLPSKIIKQVKIIENNEEMTDISEFKKIVFNDKLEKSDLFLRKTVAEKLKRATELLPNNIYFKINEAYRSLNKQKDLWNKEFSKLDNSLSEEEKIKITGKKVAFPFGSNVGGHQTGGAIDITLCDCNGNELNLGTKYLEFNEMTKSFSQQISEEAKCNRELLFSIMKKVGFNNYPMEWWHFSYGDQMWAAYNKKNKCFYGGLNE